jgi:hypothetical protein
MSIQLDFKHREGTYGKLLCRSLQGMSQLKHSKAKVDLVLSDKVIGIV